MRVMNYYYYYDNNRDTLAKSNGTGTDRLEDRLFENFLITSLGS